MVYIQRSKAKNQYFYLFSYHLVYVDNVVLSKINNSEVNCEKTRLLSRELKKAKAPPFSLYPNSGVGSEYCGKAHRNLYMACLVCELFPFTQSHVCLCFPFFYIKPTENSEQWHLNSHCSQWKTKVRDSVYKGLA